MKYLIDYEGLQYELPKYSIKTAEEIEEIDKFNKGQNKFSAKCKKMYDFAGRILGKETFEEIAGKFEDIDPNVPSIIYLKIVDAYNAPTIDTDRRRINDQLEGLPLNILNETANNLSILNGQSLSRVK